MDSTISSTIALEPASEELHSCETLISEGEYQLLQNRFDEALESFNQAEGLMSEPRPDLYYREGLALFDYGCDEEDYEALLLASKKFKTAHQLEPFSDEILHPWGNTLTQLGELQEQHHFFVEAKEKYEKAIGLGLESAEIFWDYAVIWYHIGCQSEEAVDFQKSLQYFERALENSEALPAEFWIDYGATALLLSTKIRDMRQIIKAVNCFKHAVSLDESCFDSWSSLAEALEMLYEYTHDEDHFTQANECFSTGAKLAPQEQSHWLQWANFLLTSAKRTKDVKRLRECLEKCHNAYVLNPEECTILGIWAEALALLGQLSENLDLIYEAENKVNEALDLDQDIPELWYHLGTCFTSFGHYFNDYDYFYQAIEKFQEGISLDRTYDPLWHEIANTYAIIGGLEEDSDALIQSFKFYEKALDLSPSSTRHIDYANALAKLGEINHDQKWLEQALYHFEVALSMQKNAVYLHPQWLFSYASTLDMLGDFHEEEKYYTRAIEIFSHVLMVDPDYPRVHHRLSQAFSHLGELLCETDYFYRAIHHLRLSLKQDEENDNMILDWGIALMNIAQHTPVLTDVEQVMADAEQKLTLAAKLGNIQGYYYLACLYSLLDQLDRSMAFLMKADYFNALPPLEELLNDEWLETLRGTSAFVEFLSEHPHLQE